MWHNQRLVCSKGIKASFNDFENERIRRLAASFEMQPATFVKFAALFVAELTELKPDCKTALELKAAIETDLAAVIMAEALDGGQGNAKKVS